jgi:hypothetical protein
MDRLLGRGKKPAAAAPKPPARGVAPLEGDDDHAPTREMGPRASAAAPDDQKTTAIRDVSALAKSDGVGKPPAVLVEDEEPAAPKQPSTPKPGLVEQVKAEVARLLEPLAQRLEALEGTVSGLVERLDNNDTSINSIIDELEGPDPDSDAYKEAKAAGTLEPGLKDKLAALHGVQAELDAVRQGMEGVSGVVVDLVGPNGERIPSMVDDHARVTRDLLVYILKTKEDPDEKDLEQVVVERGTATARDVLEGMVKNPQLVKATLANIANVSVVELDAAEPDSDLGKKRKVIEKLTQGVVARAEYYLENLKWDELEQKADAYRASLKS